MRGSERDVWLQCPSQRAKSTICEIKESTKLRELYISSKLSYEVKSDLLKPES